jgi:ribonuclease HI
MPNIPQIGIGEMAVVTSWYLWWMRRARTHDESVPPVKHCVASMIGLAANFIRSYSRTTIPGAIRWCPPLSNNVKLNVDDAFFEDQRAGAIAAVIRDHKGRFIAASYAYIPHVETVALAEAMAMRDGLALAQNIGCNGVQADSNSIEVINACNGEDTWSLAAAIYADCVNYMEAIGKVTFHHCPRETNKVAHNLARFSFDSKSNCNRVEEPPSCIRSNLIDDVTVL